MPIIKTYAQFEIIPGTIICKNSPNKNFVVYEFNGKSANYLYTKSLSAITSMFVSANNVTNKVDNEMINIHGVQSDIACIKQLGKTSCFTLDYNLIIRFKDGKIRIDSPQINELYCINGNGDKVYMEIDNSGTKNMGFSLSLFKKSGEPKYKEAKDQLEDFFNKMASNIKNNIEQEESSDW